MTRVEILIFLTGLLAGLSLGIMGTVAYLVLTPAPHPPTTWSDEAERWEDDDRNDPGGLA